MYLLILGVGWSAFSGSQMTVNRVTARCIRRLLVLNGISGRAWHPGCVQIIGEAYCVCLVFCASSSSHTSFLVLLPHSWHFDGLFTLSVLLYIPCRTNPHLSGLSPAFLTAPSAVLSNVDFYILCHEVCTYLNSPWAQTVLLQLDILGPGLTLLL